MSLLDQPKVTVRGARLVKLLGNEAPSGVRVCRVGHELTPDNVETYGAVTYCLTCRRERLERKK
jgi:hypothetical protein